MVPDISTGTAQSVPRSCRALFIAAPSSGQGKTTFTAALARALTRQGQCVHIFKTGPDYLDPQILRQASSNPVVPLDLWMAGDQWCQQALYEAAQSADIILVEGAMGMFDGEPSSADLAERFGIPLALLMDVKGMAQTAAIMAAGLAQARPTIKVIGLIANNCGSERHRQLIEDALPDHFPLLMTVKRDPKMALPERHLGLVQADEVRDELEDRFNTAADRLMASGLDDLLAAIPTVDFYPPCEVNDLNNQSKQDKTPKLDDQQPLKDTVVGVAKDMAFSFIYQANIDLLRNLGASIKYFSPLNDQQLPDIDALWLPGGYPELHAQPLSDNSAMIQQISAFHQAGKPILAECGGFLYCLESLTDLDDKCLPMLGLMPGAGVMRGKRGCQGMQTAVLPEGDIRGHAHHRARSEATPEALSFARRQRHPAPGEAIFRQGSLTASFLHLFFPSNPAAIVQLLTKPQNAVARKEYEVLNAD